MNVGGDLNADRQPVAAESRRDCRAGVPKTRMRQAAFVRFVVGRPINVELGLSFPGARIPKPCSANRSDARSSVSPLA
jgi:hypothetical protein